MISKNFLLEKFSYICFMKTKMDNFIKKNKIIFFVGISGSGKSTYLNDGFLNDFPEISDTLIKYNITLCDLIVCPDDIRRELTGDVNNHTKEPHIWMNLLPNRLKHNMDTYGYTILDATNTVGKSRRKFLKKFKGNEKIAVVLPSDPEVSKSRINNDIVCGVDRSNVPDYAIDRQFASFKLSVVGDERWDGEWNKVVKRKIQMTLGKEFDRVIVL